MGANTQLWNGFPTRTGDARVTRVCRKVAFVIFRSGNCGQVRPDSSVAGPHTRDHHFPFILEIFFPPSPIISPVSPTHRAPPLPFFSYELESLLTVHTHPIIPFSPSTQTTPRPLLFSLSLSTSSVPINSPTSHSVGINSNKQHYIARCLIFSILCRGVQSEFHMF